ncbi:unnamed protein product [Callosobruchus maculatus]|uniref:Uridine diphosphate glucose pyrophosphatase NUDT14 n=1 Tax=Callosobruchus maculatus TaxID=64391 RepID=A0A653CFV8_CALMS|nr:unnamed protein product [Callosobruchus maculatus]
MNKISNIVLVQTPKNSKFIKSCTMEFIQNGKKLCCNLHDIHNSVSVLIYNITRNRFVFVRQFRPAVYYESIHPKDRKPNVEIDTLKYPPEKGITLEFCSGIVDKKIPIRDIAKDEILEECGYEVPSESLLKIGNCRSGAEYHGSYQSIMYCEVNDEMRVSQGGGVGTEMIEVVEMSLDQVKQYITKEHVNSPPGFLFGIYWFLYNKRNNK